MRAPTSEQVIVRFHWCAVCDVYDGKGHTHVHFNDGEEYGYILFYDASTRWVFVAPTFSSHDSVSTEDGWEEFDLDEPSRHWLYAGPRNEFANMASSRMDIRMPGRVLSDDDWLYKETLEMYTRFLAWHTTTHD